MSLRAPTVMLAWLLMSGAAPAQDAEVSNSLFRPCGDVLSAEELAAPVYPVPSGSLVSASCLRLANKEFVIFTGGGILTTRFHYCAAHRVPACETDPFRPYSFDVEREFSGANGNRFMLWKVSRLQRGVHTLGYGIASRVPENVESRGFDVYPLAGSAIFHGEDPTTSNPCQEMGDEATEILEYEVLREATAEVELRFTERVVNCKTKKETLRLRRYRLRNGVFGLDP